MARFASITIDVDSLRFYSRIHGRARGQVDSLSADPIYTIAMSRFWELIEEARTPATLFLIGADAPQHPSAFEPLARTGSEIANHSHNHDYGLIRQSRETIRADVALADQALRPLNLNRPLLGFRAPGYNISSVLLEEVVALGYRYDSSLLPSPWYFAARGAAITTYRALRRPSASLAGQPRQFFGPLTPYRTEPAEPWKKSDGPLLEIPMSCEPRTRFPLIGTSWAMLPEALLDKMVSRTLRKLPCFIFEMHAIDLLDQTDTPALRELSASQADLRVPATKKIALFRRLFARLRDAAQVCTLAQLTEPGNQI